MNIKVPVENIVELKVEHQFIEAYQIMKQLDPNLTTSAYQELLSNDDYQLFALYHDTSIVAIAGIFWRDDLHNQRHVFVKDLVTDVNQRPSELGYNLLKYINDWAKDHGAVYITLES